jgi:hypothetical protein
MVKFYKAYSEASATARALGIKSRKEYLMRYREDPLLAPRPWEWYRKDWQGFAVMLGTDFYPTLDETIEAVRSLGITSVKEYKLRYKEDLRLPADPARVFKQSWKGYPALFNTPHRRRGIDIYKTLAEASLAVQALGIKTPKEYSIRYREDSRLPACPNELYEDDWCGFSKMLDSNFRRLPYETLKEASLAVQELGITNTGEYRRRHHLNPRLPSNPNKKYKDEWEGYEALFGRDKRLLYKTLQEASLAARALNIKSVEEYKLRCHEDPRLPRRPERYYQSFWRGLTSFLGIPGRDGAFYETLSMAREAVLRLRITNSKEYRLRYIEDDLLPSSLHIIYSDVWPGFKNFLAGIPKGYEGEIYSSIEEASNAVRECGIITKADYKKKYAIDPKLPRSPEVEFIDNWPRWGWRKYLNTGLYSFEEAGAAARALGVFDRQSYIGLHESDRRLPADPIKFYSVKWRGWVNFLLSLKCEYLKDLKLAVKIAGIKDSKDYRARYKDYTCMPSNPPRDYSDEWVSWYDLCDIPIWYDYEQLKSLVIDCGVKGIDSYRRFVTQRQDSRIPRAPDEVYKDLWVNWYSFTGKPEPYRTNFIREPYLAWGVCIDEFSKSTRAGNGKITHLCRFLREYVEKYGLGKTPEEFLTAQKIEMGLFDDHLQALSDSVIHTSLAAVREFCDYVIRKKLTFEDEETGELVIVPGARNPFASYVSDREYSGARPGETNKPALAYQHVQSICKWIIPDDALNFGDLKHLHMFEADWCEINPDLIDKSDPDCIYRRDEGKTKIWFPGYWMHTYALASVPARGRQLAYCDSGEADYEIPCFVDGKFNWVRNASAHAGLTRDQGFIKKYPNNQIGMHFTTNKTDIRGEGYNVPWIPEALAIWVVRFRAWQIKYNPIRRVMPWVECVRTNLNERQLRGKGVNCFLFRDFGEEESGFYSTRLKDRLAAALYYSQSEGLKLAECVGSPSALSSYRTQYSPHSMRVSLITAYVMEFGLPIDIVMKIAGHSSVVMTLYYLRINAEGLRVKFAEGEKRALSNQALAAIQLIEQNRIDEIRGHLIQNNEEALARYTGKGLPGSFLFRDYGFCPFAGTRCNDGGPPIRGQFSRLPTKQGYLGIQNCPSCRHFVTGPVFIGGLLSLANEISLQASIQFDHISTINEKVEENSRGIDQLDDAEYLAAKEGRPFDVGQRISLEMKGRKLSSELESAATKADMFLCDIQAVFRLIRQCYAVVNEQAADQTSENLPQLIVQNGHELALAFEESSRFHLLSEVCENAEIFESASAEAALPSRSQLLDRMFALNNMAPVMYALDKQQQLVIGNQLTRFLISRVNSWERVDCLIGGTLRLSDLEGSERVELKDISEILGAGIASSRAGLPRQSGRLNNET